ESRSLLQYLRDAFPYASGDEQAVLSQLGQMADEEREAIAALLRYLETYRHTVPYLGSFPASFTTMNFVAVDFLLPRLLMETRQAATRLEYDLTGVTDPEPHRLVEAILARKREHLKILESLVAAHKAPAAR